jgi:hypothetical protein
MSDPFLLSKWIQDGIIMIGIYVENNLKKNSIFRLMESAKSNEILLLQPHLINNFETKFGDEVKKKRVYKTAG